MNLSTLADLPLNNPTDDNVIVITVLINGAAHAYSSQDSPTLNHSTHAMASTGTGSFADTGGT
ncbi:hypothetical protein [Bifidobacterium sp. ESL0822]|uniref:hypothetical protein n=1 Tax=Bifidobacterium sp. ESL0822 TaxID=3448585 RepID=UPI004042C898